MAWEIAVEQGFAQGERTGAGGLQGEQGHGVEVAQGDQPLDLQGARVGVHIGLFQLGQGEAELMTRGQAPAVAGPVAGSQEAEAAAGLVLERRLGRADHVARQVEGLEIDAGNLTRHPVVEVLAGEFRRQDVGDLLIVLDSRGLGVQVVLGDFDLQGGGGQLGGDLLAVDFGEPGLEAPFLGPPLVLGGGEAELGDGHQQPARQLQLVAVGLQRVADLLAAIGHGEGRADIGRSVGHRGYGPEQAAGDVEGRAVDRAGDVQDLAGAEAAVDQALVIGPADGGGLLAARQRRLALTELIHPLLLGVQGERQERALLGGAKLVELGGVALLQRREQGVAELGDLFDHAARARRQGGEAIVGDRRQAALAEGRDQAGRIGGDQRAWIDGRREQRQGPDHALQVHAVADLVDPVLHARPKAGQLVVLGHGEVDIEVVERDVLDRQRRVVTRRQHGLDFDVELRDVALVALDQIVEGLHRRGGGHAHLLWPGAEQVADQGVEHHRLVDGLGAVHGELGVSPVEQVADIGHGDRLGVGGGPQAGDGVGVERIVVVGGDLRWRLEDGLQILEAGGREGHKAPDPAVGRRGVEHPFEPGLGLIEPEGGVQPVGDQERAVEEDLPEIGSEGAVEVDVIDDGRRRDDSLDGAGAVGGEVRLGQLLRVPGQKPIDPAADQEAAEPGRRPRRQAGEPEGDRRQVRRRQAGPDDVGVAGEVGPDGSIRIARLQGDDLVERTRIGDVVIGVQAGLQTLDQKSLVAIVEDEPAGLVLDRDDAGVGAGHLVQQRREAGAGRLGSGRRAVAVIFGGEDARGLGDSQDAAGPIDRRAVG